MNPPRSEAPISEAPSPAPAGTEAPGANPPGTGHSESGGTPPAAEAGKKDKQPFRWGFLSVSAVILALCVLGHVVLDMLAGVLGDLRAGQFSPVDGVFLAFLVSTSALLYLQRAAIRRFLLDMHTGVSLIGWSILAVTAGVLVPQMDGFEDPDNRITPGDHELQYQRFADAEAYFLYHLTHLYGMGMPDSSIPPGVEEKLEGFGRKYGREEELNRRKQMKAAFAGMAKRDEIQAFKERHDGFLRSFFDVSTFLHLNRAYKSFWFATLMTLVCSSVFLNLFRGPVRRWFTLAKSGFAVTHIGIVIMLVGGGFSKYNEDRGILQLFTGTPPKSDYMRYFNPSKTGRLPFWVRLNRFARLDWKQIEVGFAEGDVTSSLPTYTLWPGREIDLDFVDDPEMGLRPQLRLRVTELHEHAKVNAFKLSEATGEQQRDALGPIAVLDVPDITAMFRASQRGESPEKVSVLRTFAHLAPEFRGSQIYFGPSWSFMPSWDYRLKGMTAASLPRRGDQLDLEALFPDEELLGYLSVRELGAGDVEPQRVPVSLGQTLEVAGGYRIAVKEATANYEKDPETGAETRDARPIHQQVPWNPGLWLEIVPPAGGEAERRLVLEAVDTEGSVAQDQYEYDDLLITLDWERWSTPGPPRYVMAWGAGAPSVLIDEAGVETPLAAGDLLPLPGGDSAVHRVTVSELFNDAHADKDIEFLPSQIGDDGFDASFYSDDSRGLELEITRYPDTPREEVELVRLATSPEGSSDFANHWVSPERDFYVHFFENDRVFPFEWRSVLSVYEEDEDGRWQVFSGADGQPIETLSAEESADYQKRLGTQVRAIADVSGDGQADFIGPVKLVDLGSERKREIRVNDYFTYRGYRFFQTNANPAEPRYSGIGVVYDPGIPAVLVGMYTIIAGTVLAFLVRPMVQGKKRKLA